MEKLLKRVDVPVEQTWNLDDLFPSMAAWETELAALPGAFSSVTMYQGKLGEGPASLLACLQAEEALHCRFMRVTGYAQLRNAEDGSNPVNQANAARAAALGAEMAAAVSFIESEILSLPEGQVASYLAAEPALATYRPALEVLLERRPHQLHPETETALASLGEVFGAPAMIANLTKAADMQFAPVKDSTGQQMPMSFNLYQSRYELSPDTVLRRAAFASFAQGLAAHQNALAATLAVQIKKETVLARLRGYRSTAAMLLQPHLIPQDVYERLLDVIQANLAPHMQRYARLCRKVLGLETLMFCDLKAPLDPDFQPEITFDAAAELLVDALGVMGDDYQAIIRTALAERWVDRADNIGKRSGAFCLSPYGVHPFVHLTWSDHMRNLFMLAHELGHAGCAVLTQRQQLPGNSTHTRFFVEAPSTLNELLLGRHLLATEKDAALRRFVLSQLLLTFFHNFVTHLLEAELQRRLYAYAEAGRPITAALLNETKGAVLSGFWGNTVQIDAGARLTWTRQPHYYMGLYPYTYSAGLTCATVVAEAIYEEGRPAVDRWLKVLETGATRRPLELMRMAGVDMSVPDPLLKAVAYVGSLVTELEGSFNLTGEPSQ